jgi:hypothetical protein
MRGIDAVQQLPSINGGEDWCLALLDDILGSTHCRGWVAEYHLTNDQPVEEHFEQVWDVRPATLSV